MCFKVGSYLTLSVVSLPVCGSYASTVCTHCLLRNKLHVMPIKGVGGVDLDLVGVTWRYIAMMVVSIDLFTPPMSPFHI